MKTEPVRQETPELLTDETGSVHSIFVYVLTFGILLGARCWE